jgi:CRP-like cAMP-binding protein
VKRTQRARPLIRAELNGTEKTVADRFGSDSGQMRKEALTADHSVGVRAAFGARQDLIIETFASLRRKNVEAVPLNALLANELLAALPGEDFERLLPHLEPVALAAGDDLYGFEGVVRFAYFPETAVLSHLYTLSDGNTTEAAMVGREGLAGLSPILGARRENYSTRVLVAGSALQIRVEIIKQEFGRGGALQRIVLAYAGSRLAHLSQRAVCAGRHKVDQRLCCWLLMAHDRAGEDRLRLTHDLIAAHLGTRRAGITERANQLRDEGIIGYKRGTLRVLDRGRLEAAACECYRALGRPAARVN